MPADRRLWILTMVQAVFGVVGAFAAFVEVPEEWRFAQLLPPYGFEQILVVPLVASVLGQAVLLSVWVVGSTRTPLRRVAGLITGVAFLEALLLPSLEFEFWELIPVTAGMTMGGLLLCRVIGFQVTRPAQAEGPHKTEPQAFRISIRGLMALTVLVAVLTAEVRGFQGDPLETTFLSILWGSCSVAVGLGSLWAALGVGRPRRRWPFVMVLSPFLGGLFAFEAGSHPAGRTYIILVMLIFPAYLLVSLAGVRSCGYRIVRRAGESQGLELMAQI